MGFLDKVKGFFSEESNDTIIEVRVDKNRVAEFESHFEKFKNPKQDIPDGISSINISRELIIIIIASVIILFALLYLNRRRILGELDRRFFAFLTLIEIVLTQWN